MPRKFVFRDAYGHEGVDGKDFTDPDLAPDGSLTAWCAVCARRMYVEVTRYAP